VIEASEAGEWQRGRSLLGAYLALGLAVAAAVALSLILGSRGTAAPKVSGLYTADSPCLSGSTGKPFTVEQSGQFIDLGGGPSGSFRLRADVLAGTVRCRGGARVPLALRLRGPDRIVGTVAGARVALRPAPPTPSLTQGLVGEDAVGRLLLAMAVVIICARLAGSALGRMGQPRVIGEVLAGILLGPTLLGVAWPGAQHYLFAAAIYPALNGLSQVGLVLYLFLVGMEFDPTLLRGRMRQAVFVSNASVALPFSLGLLVSVPLYALLAPTGVRFAAFALFVGVAMSVTAFPVLARILEERRMLKGPVGAMSLTVAAIGDVSAWALLALALALARSGSGFAALVVIGWTSLFVLFMVLAVRPFLGRAAVAYAEVGQLPILWTGTIFVAVLLSSFAAQRAGVAPIFGAFVMGWVMPRNAGLTTDVSRRIDDFVGIILLPLFFAVNGLQVDLTGLNNGLLWLLTLGLLGIAVVAKGGGGFAAARWIGFSRRDSGVIGALLNTRGLTELIVLNIALSSGAISAKLFSMLVVMALVTTAMTGPALRLLDRRHELAVGPEDRLGAGEPGVAPQRSIVVAPQDEGNLGGLQTIAEALARSQPPRELVIVEGIRPRGLVAGRLRDRDEVARANRLLDERRRLLAGMGIVARVAAFSSSDPSRDYLRIASREEVDLLLVDGRRPLFGEGVLTGPVARLLDRTPCDVAVLVDRNETPLIGALHAVAVPFGGAKHDWAALELGASIASVRRATVRLIGSAGAAGRADAGHLLEQAATVVRGFMGVEVETVLATPGDGILEATAEAGLFVIGLAEDWRQRGIGSVRTTIARMSSTSVLFVRGGRDFGLLGAEGPGLTRLSWSSLDPVTPAESDHEG